VLYRADRDTFRKGIISDFDAHGARVYVRSPLPVGSQMACHLNLPESGGGDARMLCIGARVISCVDTARGGVAQVQFEGGEQADLQRFQRWLHAHLLLTQAL
ncbi:unnamed protein product, partial [Phaeothamnion confervicola]